MSRIGGMAARISRAAHGVWCALLMSPNTRGINLSRAIAYKTRLGSVIWIWHVPMTATSTARGSARPQNPGTSSCPEKARTSVPGVQRCAAWLETPSKTQIRNVYQTVRKRRPHDHRAARVDLAVRRLLTEYGGRLPAEVEEPAGNGGLRETGEATDAVTEAGEGEVVEGRQRRATTVADSWRRARITKEIIALYSMKTKIHCSRTVGRIPRMAKYTRPAMIAVATSHVTGSENVSPVGATTKRKYAPARVILPTLANVDTATFNNPVPTPMDGVTASPTQT